ncbi:MAG: NAD(P)/FAD-dependent oxidoreductase, partial [Pseudomonadota bacterium]
ESLKRRDDGRWSLKTTVGVEFAAPAIAIAAGGGSFVPRRIPLPGATDYEDSSLYYAVRRAEDFYGKDIVVAGGGDSALDWLLSLQPNARSITLLHRRDDFRAAPDSVAKMRALVADGSIDLRIGQIVGFEGANHRLSGLRIKHGTDEEILACDTVLAFFGLKMDLGPIAGWGLNLERNLIVVDTEAFETNQPGLFAIGDVASYPGKLKLILSGFHEAALMCQKAFQYCRPEERNVFRYTTSSTELHKKLGVT